MGKTLFYTSTRIFIYMERICKTCNQKKPISEYGIHRRYKDGKNPKCRKCYNAYISQYRECNMDKIKITQKEYYNKNREMILKKQRERYRAQQEPNKSNQ